MILKTLHLNGGKNDNIVLRGFILRAKPFYRVATGTTLPTLECGTGTTTTLGRTRTRTWALPLTYSKSLFKFILKTIMKNLTTTLEGDELHRLTPRTCSVTLFLVAGARVTA